MRCFRLSRFVLIVMLSAVIGGAWGPRVVHGEETGAVRGEATGFASVIPDLPLIAGLEEDSDLAVAFETASGRIAQVFASGVLEQGRVGKFYATTLPQLGWHPEPAKEASGQTSGQASGESLEETPVRYRRDGEVLVLEITRDAARPRRVNVHFNLAPATP